MILLLKNPHFKIAIISQGAIKVLKEAVEVITRGIAPILCFTAEEAAQHFMFLLSFFLSLIKQHPLIKLS